MPGLPRRVRDSVCLRLRLPGPLQGRIGLRLVHLLPLVGAVRHADRVHRGPGHVAGRGHGSGKRSVRVMYDAKMWQFTQRG